MNSDNPHNSFNLLSSSQNEYQKYMDPGYSYGNTQTQGFPINQQNINSISQNNLQQNQIQIGFGNQQTPLEGVNQEQQMNQPLIGMENYSLHQQNYQQPFGINPADQTSTLTIKGMENSSNSYYKPPEVGNSICYSNIQEINTFKNQADRFAFFRQHISSSANQNFKYDNLITQGNQINQNVGNSQFQLAETPNQGTNNPFQGQNPLPSEEEKNKIPQTNENKQGQQPLKKMTCVRYNNNKKLNKVESNKVPQKAAGTIPKNTFKFPKKLNRAKFHEFNSNNEITAVVSQGNQVSSFRVPIEAKESNQVSKITNQNMTKNALDSSSSSQYYENNNNISKTKIQINLNINNNDNQLCQNNNQQENLNQQSPNNSNQNEIQRNHQGNSSNQNLNMKLKVVINNQLPRSNEDKKLEMMNKNNERNQNIFTQNQAISTSNPFSICLNSSSNSLLDLFDKQH